MSVSFGDTWSPAFNELLSTNCEPPWRLISLSPSVSLWYVDVDGEGEQEGPRWFRQISIILLNIFTRSLPLLPPDKHQINCRFTSYRHRKKSPFFQERNKRVLLFQLPTPKELIQSQNDKHTWMLMNHRRRWERSKWFLVTPTPTL